MLSHKLYRLQNMCYRATTVNAQWSCVYILYIRIVKESNDNGMNFKIFLTIFLPEAVISTDYISPKTPFLEHYSF